MKQVYMKFRSIILSILFLGMGLQAHSQISPSDPDYGLYGLWSRRAPFGSLGSADLSTSMTDEEGNVYLSGKFTGTLNFADDLCSPVMSSVNSTQYGRGLFLMKLDKSGKYQWHITYKISQGTFDPDPYANTDALIYDYKDGKLLLYGRFVFFGTMNNLQTTVTLNNGTPATYNKPANVTNSRCFFNFLHVVDVNDGTTKSFVSPFTAKTQNVTARFEGDDIHTIHMAWEGDSDSKVSIYDVDGNKKGSDITYPDQPYAAPKGTTGCGSTIAKHLTLADGRQVMVHNSYDKIAPNVDIPTYYLLFYDENYTSQDRKFVISSRAIEYFPQMTTDNANNLYMATNYGKSAHYSTGVAFDDSNHLDNYLGSGNTYYTSPQKNKVVMSKMKPDYSIEWMFMIGNSNSATDETVVVARDMKTVGDYTYLVGYYMGNNIDFNGVTLGNSWNYDAFYAVFDNNDQGRCLYAVSLGDVGYEEGATLSLSADASKVLIGGIYNSRVFQPDPSGRLFPISSNGSTNHGFAALYSVNKSSQPVVYPSSYGDAPLSYGVAAHHVYSCVKLGDIDPSGLQSIPVFSIGADTDLNDDAINIPYAGSYVDLSSADFNMASDGNLYVKVNVHNAAPTNDDAKLIGWIDFNRNGVFDGADEASQIKVVPSGTTGIQTLVWERADTLIQNGVTYMRLRITTDHMDREQPQGLFFNGEVEDYYLNFNVLELNKTGVSNNVNPNNADVGDTITYSIVIKNNLAATVNDINLFDPIPEGTAYVQSSAKVGNNAITTAQPQNVTINGQSVPSVVWPAFNLAGGATSETFSFKVVVVDKPANADSIYNIAYAVVNGDTIPSIGNNCNLVGIEVNKIRAVDDIVGMLQNTTTEVDVLANDYYLSGCIVVPEINLLTPENGSASLSGHKIIYTPNVGFYGVDTITYSITCGGVTSSAHVRVIVYKIPDNISDATCFVDPESFEWAIKNDFTSNEQDISTYAIPLVGDLNNDGTPEIIVPKFLSDNGLSSSGLRKFKGIYVYWGHDRNNPTLINTVEGNFDNLGPLALAKVKLTPTGTPEPIVVMFDNVEGYLYAYSPDPNNTTEATSRIWKSTAPITGFSSKMHNSISFASFMNDGNAEIYIGNQIFDAANGTLLVDGNSGGNKGATLRGVVAGAYAISPIAADIDGDGRLEFVAGNEVYRVNINDRNDHLQNNMELIASIEAPVVNGYAVKDGLTVVADINRDGYLDVIYASVSHAGSTNTELIVWDVKNNKLLGTAKTYSRKYHGLPLIGNIDNESGLEIVMSASVSSSAGKVEAYRWNGTTGLDLVYSVGTSDYSGTTGITLFDFNLDNTMELVYRDETHLRIMHAVPPSSGTVGSFENRGRFDATSLTGYEYPVVADVDNDGSAEIVTIGGTTTRAPKGTLRIYKSGNQYSWAPARRVWNQYVYNVVNINEDLTIPEYQLNPAISFPGTLGLYDIQPYNAFLQQQTTLNTNGTPLWLAPSAQIDPPNTATFEYFGDGDSLQISLTIKNEGEAALQAPLKITVHKNAVPGTIKYTYAYPHSIQKATSATVTFAIPDYLSWLGTVDDNTKIIVRINDNGNGYNDQAVCDSTDIKVEQNVNSLIMAMNDYTQTVINVPIIIDVITNDEYPSSCTPVPENITNPTTNGGRAELNGNKIEYTPAMDYVGADTLYYTIKCGSEESRARVVIIVHNPDNISTEDCYDDPEGFKWDIKQDFISASENNHNFTTPLVGDIDGDGIPDIVTISTNKTQLNIYWGKNRATTNVPSTITLAGGVDINWSGGGAISPFAIFKTKIGNEYKSIAVVNHGSNIYAYDLNGPANQSTGYLWKTELTNNNSINRSAIGIADFNNDGVPEVYVRNKIFNGHTGKLLVAGTGNSGYCHSDRGSEYFTVAADVTGDYKLELIAGSEVYSVNIVDTANNLANVNTLTRIAKLNTTFDNGTTVVTDGKTVVVDINQDGKLDVVFITSNGGTKKLVAWDVETESLIAQSADFSSVCTGIPLIGNIDDTPDLEVTFVIYNKLVSYKANTTTNKFDLAYQLTVADRSGATGMTLFDFNQNKTAEIVYRDESRLRIMRTVPPVTSGGVGSFENLKVYTSGSGTWYEYPIVADVDNDGAGEIVVIASRGGGYQEEGSLIVYRSGTENSWAPARRVWNQYAYNAVNVNDDLTIPRFQMNPAIMFPGNIQPYNAFLQQQTMLNKEGKPLYLLPDVKVITTPEPQLEYYPDGDSIVLTLQFENIGASALQVPAYVTAYKNSMADGNAIATDSIMTAVFPGETATTTVTIRNVHDYMPMDNIVVFINDNKGKGGIGRPECDDTNNNYTFSGLFILADDYVYTNINTPVDIDILENDLFGGCNGGDLEVKMSDTWKPLHGEAEIIVSSTDTIVRYTPATNWVGVDSMRYLVTDCNNAVDSAWIYVLTLKPYALQYVACPGASVTMGFEKITDVIYNWYDESDNLVKTNSDTIIKVKDSSPVQTWWVEPVYKGKTFPRYKVDLLLSESCGGEQADCTVNGTLLFKEDFGGNEETDEDKPLTSPLADGVTTYTFVQNYHPNAGQYSINKGTVNDPLSNWLSFSDHTHEGDYTKGYVMLVNAHHDPGRFYTDTINDLCPDMELYFSAWAANLMQTRPDLSNYLDVKLRFVLEDLATGNVLSEYSTGHIPKENDGENNVVWKQYGFKFTTGNSSSIIFKIYNDEKGGNGNDLVLDDIEVHLCVPQVEITKPVANDTIVCKGSDLSLEGNYSDPGGVFGDDLEYRWEYSITGDVSKPGDWIVINGASKPHFSGIDGTSANGSVNSILAIDGIQPDDIGYYRLVVANASKIDHYNCRAMSRVIRVNVYNSPEHYPDIRVQSCPNIGEINLSSYIDTTDFVSVVWSLVSAPSAGFQNNGTISTAPYQAPNTYAYKYEVTNHCYTAQGKLYLKVLKDETISLPPDTIVVCYEDARSLQLNRIFGIEAGGKFKPYNDVDNKVKDYLRTAIAPEIYAGAVIFNGYAAYNGLTESSYNYTYHGIASKKVEFIYDITDTNSCLYNNGKEHKLVVILTSTYIP